MYLLQYHELIKNLVISDLKVKYASSMLGFAWSLLNPLAMMAILYFVFSNVFKSSEQYFVLYILIGILWWRFFSLGTGSALRAIVSKPSLVTKVYIPRETLTLSAVISCLISSMLEFVVLFPMLYPHWPWHSRNNSFIPDHYTPGLPGHICHIAVPLFFVRILP